MICEKYISAKGDTSLLREDTELITETDALAEFMFLGLRLTEGVSFVRFRQRFGKEMDTVYGKELQELAELGLLFARRKRCAAEQNGGLM